MRSRRRSGRLAHVARAQQPAMPVVGFLVTVSFGNSG